MPSVVAHAFILISSLIAGLQYEITAELGNKGPKTKKKMLTICLGQRLKILTSDLCASLIRI